MSDSDNQSYFIFIEARPKFQRYTDVSNAMAHIVDLINELYGGNVTYQLKLNIGTSRRKVSFHVIFDELQDKEALEQNRRFQELLIDIRLASKRDRSLHRKQLVATATPVV